MKISPKSAELEAHVVALKKEGLQAGGGRQVDLLFVKPGGPEGRWPLSQRDVQCELKRVCKAAGLEIRNPHDLRHTYATILLMAGAGGGGKRGANFSFSENDAVDACVAAELFKYGITYKVIAAFLKDFRQDYDYGSRNIDNATGEKSGKWAILQSVDKKFEATIRHAARPKVERRMSKDRIACLVIDMAEIEDRIEKAYSAE